MKLQKRLAAQLKNVGVERVKIVRPEDVKEAITREDIRLLLKSGAIKIKRKKGISRVRARKTKEQQRKGRRRGPGRRTGSVKDSKEKWMRKVKAQRKFIKMLREKEKIDHETYRDVYRKIGGGYFRSVQHIKTYLKKAGEKVGT